MENDQRQPHETLNLKGIGYREWLIGQIAAGQDLNLNKHTKDGLAQRVIEFADCILARMGGQ